MNKTSDILKGFSTIEAQLKTITKANGYNHDAHIRQGWLQHIARRSQHNMEFPIVAVRPELSTPRGGNVTQNTSLTDTITISLDCAVSSDNDNIIDDLVNLLKDVRRSLVFCTNNKKLGISELEIMECPFDVPEAGESYAFFSQKIQFKVVEQYA